MTNEEEKNDIIPGQVIEALPSTLFKVKLSNGETIIAYLSGKMRMHKIKVLVGDKVAVKVDEYGGKGRVVKRL